MPDEKKNIMTHHAYSSVLVGSVGVASSPQEAPECEQRLRCTMMSFVLAKTRAKVAIASIKATKDKSKKVVGSVRIAGSRQAAAAASVGQAVPPLAANGRTATIVQKGMGLSAGPTARTAGRE
jgi:hypothetical protein